MTQKQRRPPLPEMTAAQQNTRKNNTIVKPDSQPEKLLAALQSGPVTTTEAIYEMYIPHPAGAVHRLRLQGHDVQTVLRPAEFPDGEIRWAAEYLLVHGVGAGQ